MENDPQDEPPSALLRLAMRIYNSGYRAGHHDTVESAYTDIVGPDMENYHEEEAAEIVQNFLGVALTDEELRDIQTIFDDAPIPTSPLLQLEALGNIAIWHGRWAPHVEGKGGTPIVEIVQMDDDGQALGDRLGAGETLLEAVEDYLSNAKGDSQSPDQ